MLSLHPHANSSSLAELPGRLHAAASSLLRHACLLYMNVHAVAESEAGLAAPTSCATGACLSSAKAAGCCQETASAAACGVLILPPRSSSTCTWMNGVKAPTQVDQTLLSLGCFALSSTLHTSCRFAFADRWTNCLQAPAPSTTRIAAQMCRLSAVLQAKCPLLLSAPGCLCGVGLAGCELLMKGDRQHDEQLQQLMQDGGFTTAGELSDISLTMMHATHMQQYAPLDINSAARMAIYSVLVLSLCLRINHQVAQANVRHMACKSDKV